MTTVFGKRVGWHLQRTQSTSLIDLHVRFGSKGVGMIWHLNVNGRKSLHECSEICQPR